MELHIHPDVGVCSIRYDELMAVLLLRQQREHAVQPPSGLWNGRAARDATGSKAGYRTPAEMRKWHRAGPTLFPPGCWRYVARGVGVGAESAAPVSGDNVEVRST